MKKFLSLVLALVMTMSLVTVSAGAADFDDADDITYVEAVDVLSAIGVIDGMPDGSFDPQGSLTRAQAAKIICALTLTPKTASLLTADTAPFADVAASHWAAGYIADGVQSGILAGVGDNKFNPDGKLIGYAYLKMLLVALGYDANVEGLTGANWTVNVAKLADELELTKGNDDFVGSAEVTREEAALYALNALQTTMVKYASKGTQVTINGAVIATGASEATAVTGTASKYANISAAVNSNNEYTVQLGEKVFSKLLKQTTGAAGADDFNRPAHTWKLSDETDAIGTYADTAKYTLTLAKSYTNALDVYKQLVDKKATSASFEATCAYEMNGTSFAATYSTEALGSGDIVEFYLDNGKVTDVIVTRYSIGKISKVDTKTVSKADKEDGVTCKVTLAGSIYKDTNIAGFDADTYVKGAYVLYVAGAGAKVIASQVAETVEGKVTAVKGTKACIDGTYYDVVCTMPSINDKGTFYLNAAGDVCFCDATGGKSDNYALIYSVKKNGTTNDGVSGTTYTAYVALADGTKASYTVEKDSATGTGSLNLDQLTYNTDKLAAMNKAVAYSVNDDGELVVEGYSDYYGSNTGVNNDKTSSLLGTITVDGATKNAYGTSDTVYIFVDNVTNAAKVKVSVVTGYKNVDLDNETVEFIADKDGNALYVFVKNAKQSVTSSEKLAVILDEKASVTKDGSDYYYAYSVAIDGVEDELVVKNSTLNVKTGATLAKGDVIAYELDGEYVSTAAKKPTATVDYVGSGYFITVGGTLVNLTDDSDLYTVTIEHDYFGAFESIDVTADAELEKNDVVVYTVNSDNEVKTLFLIENVW